MAMSQIVQADPGKAAGTDQSGEGVGQHARRPRAAVLTEADVGIVCLADAEGQQLLCLADSVPAQLLNNQGGEGDRSGLPGLGWLLAHALGGLLDAG